MRTPILVSPVRNTIDPRRSPPLVLEELLTARGKIRVVRDDLLEGGTKQRALLPYIEERRREGYGEFVYASPFSGFAQVALATSCAEKRTRCTLFCEALPGDGPLKAHEFTRLAAAKGAEVHLLSSLGEAEVRAEAYAAGDPDALKMPLGFNCDRYKQHLRTAITEQWAILCRVMGEIPSTLWLPLGSGTLASVFRTVLTEKTSIQCVDVHVLPADDYRVLRLRKSKWIGYHSAPEAFHTPAGAPPPIPSNAYYDAKIWRFLSEHAEAGSVWWNVGR